MRQSNAFSDVRAEPTEWSPPASPLPGQLRAMDLPAPYDTRASNEIVNTEARHESAPITLVVADTHPLMLRGLQSLIRSQSGFQIVEACLDGEAALAAIRKHLPTVAVLGIAMPGRTGLQVSRAVWAEECKTRTVLLSAVLADSDIYAGIQMGVAGFMLKEYSPEMFMQCLREVAAGGNWYPEHVVGEALEREKRRRDEGTEIARKLTPRERQILLIAGQGLSNKEIARELQITDGTAKLHLHSIYQKLSVFRRSELVDMVDRHRDQLLCDPSPGGESDARPPLASYSTNAARRA